MKNIFMLYLLHSTQNRIKGATLKLVWERDTPSPATIKWFDIILKKEIVFVSLKIKMKIIFDYIYSHLQDRIQIWGLSGGKRFTHPSPPSRSNDVTLYNKRPISSAPCHLETKLFILIWLHIVHLQVTIEFMVACVLT